MKTKFLGSVIALAVAGAMAAPAFAGGATVEELKAQVASLTAELEVYRAEEALIEHNLSLMTMADVSMNARDWDGFNSVHSHDVRVKSPDAPVTTTDRDSHLEIVKSFVNAFPDHRIEQPYVALIGQGDKVCAVHQNGGTFTQPWHLPGTDIVIPPNGNHYTMKMVTIATAKGDELIEEQIFYDMADMAKQLGLAGAAK